MNPVHRPTLDPRPTRADAPASSAAGDFSLALDQAGRAPAAPSADTAATPTVRQPPKALPTGAPVAAGHRSPLAMRLGAAVPSDANPVAKAIASPIASPIANPITDTLTDTLTAPTTNSLADSTSRIAGKSSTPTDASAAPTAPAPTDPAALSALSALSNPSTPPIPSAHAAPDRESERDDEGPTPMATDANGSCRPGVLPDPGCAAVLSGLAPTAPGSSPGAPSAPSLPIGASRQTGSPSATAPGRTDRNPTQLLPIGDASVRASASGAAPDASATEPIPASPPAQAIAPALTPADGPRTPERPARRASEALPTVRDGIPSIQLASPTATTPGAGGVQAELSAPPLPQSQAAFATELSAQVTHWVQQGVQRAELRLDPSDLGPVQVSIQLEGTHTQVHFVAEVASTREALQAALPDLAQALGQEGLTLGSVDVQARHQDPHQRPPGGTGAGDSHRGRAFAPPDARGNDAFTAPEPSPHRPLVRRGLVDLYA